MYYCDHPIGCWPRLSIAILAHTETHLLAYGDAYQQICVLCWYNRCNRYRRGREIEKREREKSKKEGKEKEKKEENTYTPISNPINSPRDSLRLGHRPVSLSHMGNVSRENASAFGHLYHFSQREIPMPRSPEFQCLRRSLISCDYSFL